MNTPTGTTTAGDSSDALRKRVVMPPPSSVHPSSTLHYPTSASQGRRDPPKDAVVQEDDSDDYGDGSGILRFLYSRYILYATVGVSWCTWWVSANRSRLVYVVEISTCWSDRSLPSRLTFLLSIKRSIMFIFGLVYYLVILFRNFSSFNHHLLAQHFASTNPLF